MRLFDVMTEEREKDGEDWKIGFRCTERGHSLCLHSTALRSFAMSGEGEEHQYNKATIKPELLEKKIDWLALLPAPLNRRPRAMRNAAPSPAWTSIPANYLSHQTSLANNDHPPSPSLTLLPPPLSHHPWANHLPASPNSTLHAPHKTPSNHLRSYTADPNQRDEQRDSTPAEWADGAGISGRDGDRASFRGCNIRTRERKV